MWRTLCLFAPVLAVAIPLLTGPVNAQKIPIDGPWQVADGDPAATSCETAPEQWSIAGTAPLLFWGVTGRNHWVRTEIELPAPDADAEAVLHLPDVSYVRKLLVNDIPIAGVAPSAWAPVEFDITSAVAGGGAVTIQLCLADWSALFASPVDFGNCTAKADPAECAEDTLQAPVGSRYYWFGLQDPPFIEVSPLLRVGEVFTETLVDAAELRIRIQLVNHGAEPVMADLLAMVEDDQGIPAKSLGQQGLVLAPGEKWVTLVTKWEEPELWSPEHPYLYKVRARLKQAANVLHETESMFGFRQVRADGASLLFNEVPATFQAWEAMLPSPVGPSAALAPAQRLADLKERTVQLLFMAGGPWPEAWLDAADAVGLPVVLSSDLVGGPWDTYRVDDDAFWQQAGGHVEALIRTARRHPSVMGYNLADFAVAAGNEAALEQLKLLTSMAATLDPTRLILGEWNLHDESADAYLVRSPQPMQQCWGWPGCEFHETDTITSPTSGQAWAWPMDKPLLVLSLFDLPEEATDFLGLLGPSALRNRADSHAAAIADLVPGLLRSILTRPVAAVSPAPALWPTDDFFTSGWVDNPYQDLLWPVFQPVQFVLDERNRHFAAGQAQGITFRMVATGTQARAGVVTITDQAGTVIADKQVVLEPGGTVGFQFPLSAPFPAEGAQRLEFHYAAEFADDQGAVWSADFEFVSHLVPALDVVVPTVWLFDPTGEAAQALDEWVKVEVVPSLGSLPASSELVVVGEGGLSDAVPEDSPPPVYEPAMASLLEFVDRGGVLVVLAQESAGHPLGPRLLHQPVRRLFADPDQPLMAAIGQHDLEAWAPDGPVADYLLRPPPWGSFECLVSGGEQGGHQGCAIARIPRGQGLLFLVQVPLTSLQSGRPVARKLLRNLLDLAAGEAEQLRPRRLLLAQGSSPSPAQALGLPTVGPETETKECRGLRLEDWRQKSVDALLDAIENQGPDPLWALLEPSQWSEMAQTQHWDGIVDLSPLTLPLLTSGEGPVGLTDLLFADWRDEVLPGWVEQAVDLPTGSDWEAVLGEPLIDPGCSACGSGSHLGHFVLDDPRSGDLLVELEGNLETLDGTPLNLWLRGCETTVQTRVAAGQDAVRLLLPCGAGAAAEIVVGAEPHQFDVDLGLPAPVEIDGGTVRGVQWPDWLAPAVNPPLLLAGAKAGRDFVLDFLGALASTDSLDDLQVASELLRWQGIPVDTPLSLSVPATQMAIEGSMLHDTVDGVVWLKDNGQLVTEATFPASARYRFMVTGQGTPAAGEYPRPEITVDGVKAGQLQLGPNLQAHFADATIAKGVHTVGLAFVDDAFLPSEDRDAGFLTLEIALLAGNSAPYATVQVLSNAPVLTAHAGCLFDPDNDPVTVEWLLTTDGCGGDLVVEQAEGSQVEFEVDDGTYWLFMTVLDDRGAQTVDCERIEFAATATEQPPEGTADVVIGEPMEQLDIVQQEIREYVEPVDDIDSGTGKPGGCGCRVSGGTRPLPVVSLLALLAMFLFCRRRRRQA